MKYILPIICLINIFVIADEKTENKLDEKNRQHYIVNSQSFRNKNLKPIYFKQWSNEINNKDDLDQNIFDLKKLVIDYPSWKVLIVGNASRDSNGEFQDDNLIISLERANIIAKALIENGIPSYKVNAFGVGYEDAQVDPAKGIEAQSKDRRADLYIAI